MTPKSAWDLAPDALPAPLLTTGLHIGPQSITFTSPWPQTLSSWRDRSVWNTSHPAPSLLMNSS